MNNIYIKSATDLVTTHESRRSGFLEYALRRNKESIPYIDKAKALKAKLSKNTNKPSEILNLPEIKESLLDASGVSVKARAHLLDEDKNKLIADFISEVLEPCGEKYIEELIFRYLLTAGDALGGKMRNIVGSIANEKLTRFIISQLQISQIEFKYFVKGSQKKISGKNYTTSDSGKIKAIKWKNLQGQRRSLIYNLTVPIVKKNIDIILLDGDINTTKVKDLSDIVNAPENYICAGELKGGIDPAGADEHWKTANTSLGRIRKAFKSKISIFFIGAAIEVSMSKEIFDQYKTGDLENCANLASDDQLAALCDWLIQQ